VIKNVGRAIIIRFDHWLSDRYGIQTFTQDEKCILRFAIAKSPRDLVLDDGTQVRKGEVVGVLHFWNEHIPPMPPEGPGFAWGMEFYHRLRRSLRDFVAFMEHEPSLQGIRVFCGETAFLPRGNPEWKSLLAEGLGFSFIPIT
jgi:hypothetical protein